MRDLYVYTADADAMGVIRAVLDRPKAIGIRAMDCEVDRHTGRDPGMVKDGPELVRFRKTAFQRALLIWDHEGSGWERRSPEEAQHEVRVRLDQCTWKDRSYAVVIVPELEEWLWHNPVSIARHLGVAVQRLEEWVADFAEKRKTSCDSCRQLTPKELLADMFYRQLQAAALAWGFRADRKECQPSELAEEQVVCVGRCYPEGVVPKLGLRQAAVFRPGPLEFARGSRPPGRRRSS